jgi:tRNA(fMet)-specific endonuclease VapC
MKYLLDTNICIYLIKREPATVMAKFRRHALGEVGLSTVTLAELEHGVAKSRLQEQNRRALERFVLPLETVPFEAGDSQACGPLRARLERLGTPIGPLDLLIASQALRRGLIVVTNNTREFRRVPKLALENWT